MIIIPVPTTSKTDLYRKLPSVDELLHSTAFAAIISGEGHAAVTDAARSVLTSLRAEIAAGRLDAAAVDLALSGLPDAVARQVRQSLSYSLRPVINATGVILHTNLGRAPLAASALEHVREAASGYSNLEFDIESGQRGQRDVHVDRLFRKLLNEGFAGEGARATFDFSTIVVNNNAAAVLLALNTLAEGGEVIVRAESWSRSADRSGIPDVMSKSNATPAGSRHDQPHPGGGLRTRDQRKDPVVAALHRPISITGFTEQPELAELAALACKRTLPLMETPAAARPVDFRWSVGVSGEPSVPRQPARRRGRRSATAETWLLGGPQAGAQRPRLIYCPHAVQLCSERCVWMLRTYAALEATLLAYVKSTTMTRFRRCA